MKLLYLCTGNSARSIMAEALTRSLLPSSAPVEIFSAGTEPKGVHSVTSTVLEEAGIDISGLRSKSIEEVPFEQADLVITLCDGARASCPAPPKRARVLHWGLRDPAAATGTEEEILETFRDVRTEVMTCVKRLLFELATDPLLRGVPSKGA
jgi:arsenate reductase